MGCRPLRRARDRRLLGWCRRLAFVAALGLSWAIVRAADYDPIAVDPVSGNGSSIAEYDAVDTVYVERTVEPPYTESQASGATKTRTHILETPQSVSVISRERLDDLGVQSVQEALRYVGGVRSDPYGIDSRSDQALVRGSDPLIVLDGLRALFGYFSNARPDPYALETVEIVRGPASVLYGEGSTGGIVALASKRPQRDALRELRVDFGDPDRLQYAVDLTGPVPFDDALSFRLIALQRKADTQVDYVPDDRWFASPAITWAPEPWIRWTLLGWFQESDSGSSTAFLPWSGTVLPNPNGQIPTNRFVSEPGFDQYDTRQSSVTSMLTIEPLPWLRFNQNLRYSASEVDYRTMYPNVYVPPQQPYFLDPRQRSVLRIAEVIESAADTLTADQNVELRWGGSRLAHSLLLGYDVARAELGQQRGQLSTAQILAQGLFDLYEPVYGRYIEPEAVAMPETVFHQNGVYAQDQMRIAERFIVLLGARFDEASTKVEGSAPIEDDETSLRGGLMYRFRSGLAPYLSYSESFQTVAQLDEDGAPYEPIRGKQTEVGLKFQPPSGRGLFTIAAFKTNEKNRLVQDYASANAIQVKADLKGLELEAATTLFEVLDVLASYTWIDAEVDRGTAVDTDERYRVLAGVPQQMASLWAHWRFELFAVPGFSVGAGLRYIGQTRDESEQITVPAVTLVDAMAAFEAGHWRLALNASNVENDVHVSSCLERGDCFYGPRRVVTGTVTYRF